MCGEQGWAHHEYVFASYSYQDLPHVILIELRQALLSYQDNHMFPCRRYELHAPPHGDVDARDAERLHPESVRDSRLPRPAPPACTAPVLAVVMAVVLVLDLSSSTLARALAPPALCHEYQEQ